MEAPTTSQGNTKEENIWKCLKLFRNEVRALCLPEKVPAVEGIPPALEFYRNWVAPNVPVLIKNGIKHWPAVEKWDKDYLIAKLKDKLVSVGVSPNDCTEGIKEVDVSGKPKEMLVLPEERLMTMSEFYAQLENSGGSKNRDSGVFYIQKQNSNLVEEFPELLPDIDAKFPWASEVFKGNPTAINLWIGDERGVTSLHKDPFESIYCVISGQKQFTLFPPTDRPWLPYELFPIGQFKENSPGSFEISAYESDGWVYKATNGSFQTKRYSWVALDPNFPNHDKFPLYYLASPLNVKVDQGDALYVPSLWFHYAKQSHKCIAVNFWYDMGFDIKCAYFHLLENLSTHLKHEK